MRERRRIVVVGAGGLAREVAWLISDINKADDSFVLVGHIVTDLSKLGEHDSHDRVLGDYSWVERNRKDIDALAIGIGTPAARLNVSADLETLFPDLEWPALIHPTAQFERASTKVGHGTILCAGVIGTVNLTFDPFSFVNLACTIGHEARIGRGCVLNPTVNVSGGVVLEDGVLVGTGAQILQYVRVGRGAIIRAGAVVTKEVPEGNAVFGVPAKPFKKI